MTPTAICARLSANVCELRRSLDLEGINILGYLPNLGINAIGTAIFGVLALAHISCHRKWRAPHMLAMTVGVWCYTFGLITRFPSRSHPDSLGLYLIQQFFIILPPCAFIASVYAILGQLGSHLDADDCMPISTAGIAKTFIWSDVITFTIQSGGAGLEPNPKVHILVVIGSKIFLVGLILQLLSFIAFCAVFLVFLHRLRSLKPNTWQERRWWPLAWALAIACVCILVRSIFRTVENAQGYQGYLSVHEVYFWTLDALPMAITVGVFVPFWPNRILPALRGEVPDYVMERLRSK